MATYAIIKTGGKQVRVMKDQVIDIELVDGEQGSTVEFDDVLLFSNGTSVKVGEPKVANCVVKGELLETVRGPKINAIKYKRRKNQYRRWGHRQDYSRIKIVDIAS